MFKAMFAFLRKPEPKVQIQLLRREPCRLTVMQWRSTPDLVKIASRCLHDHEFRSLLDVLEFNHPGNVSLPLSAESHMRAFWQARCEGYTAAISDLKSLAEHYKPTEDLPPATFEDEQHVP